MEDNNDTSPLKGVLKLTIADKSLTTLIGSPHPEAGAPLRSSKNRHAGRMSLSNYNTWKEQVFHLISSLDIFKSGELKFDFLSYVKTKKESI